MKIGCDSKIKKKWILFVFRSPCTIFIYIGHEDRLRLGNKKEMDSFCISLALHYLCTLNLKLLWQRIKQSSSKEPESII